ncbi:MAG TPA: ABC transporter permease [Clostridia bacterium]|nr:ABC transporter permease [Clostridia bacterium]
MVLRRMFSNLWMVICLLLGSILATALVSCIPIYTDSILQRMLIKDLENYQVKTGNFPGQYDVRAKLNYNYKPEDRVNAARFFDKKIMSEKIPQFDLPVMTFSQGFKLGNLYTPATKKNQNDDSDMMYIQLGTLSGLQDHIKLTNGRLFAAEPVDGVYEVIVNQQAMKGLNLLLDQVYPIMDPTEDYKELCRVKVVGVYTVKGDNDAYWSVGINEHNQELMMDYKLFGKEFLSDANGLVTEARWDCALDYHKITLQNLSKIAGIFNEQNRWYSRYRGSIDFSMPISAILKDYNERANQLRTMLWVLTVPVLIMLVFYIFMVSQLIVRHDENGIAVLKSRGASMGQIFLSYLLESSLISVVAFIFGPLVGMFICTILGSSNGFLEFVQRTALPVSLSPKVIAYSFAAVVFLIVTMLAPVIAASRTTIVKHKQDKSRSRKAPVWKKFFFDIVLLLISGYGLYRYQQQQKILATTGVKANDLQIDPLLFLTSTVFVVGAGLLFIRIYPYLISFVYWLGRKVWSPAMYISLIQVGRSRGQEQFLMLFIILAISTGLFNANSARTINQNIEDKISYSIGADVRLLAAWKDTRPPEKAILSAQQQEALAKEAASPMPVRYIEPDYSKYSSLAGTSMATKVIRVNNGAVQTSGDLVENVNIMGIIPDQFAKIAWFRPDLLKPHWYNYINLMTDAPTAFLVSTDMKEKYKLSLGDTIYITWSEQGYLEGTIFAFIDYWPTYNPNPPEQGKEAPGLVVANLDYIQNKMALSPYEVWLKKADGATDKQINDDVIKRDLQLDDIKYMEQEIVKMKNDAMIQGMNGMLTLGFVAAMLISMLGFLIYWIISIQDRVLQFGILRAMGMSLTRVIGMLACEQVFVSGAAIIMGIVVGGLAGDLFIPLLQIVYSSADQVPPFKVMSDGSDYIKIYSVIGTMLLMGFLTLWKIISGIRIDQAVKLGED